MAPPADEFELIATYFAPLAKGEPGALGLGDDAGVLTVPPDRELVVTADAIVEGVHYPEGLSAWDVARRLLRVNLSDLAAKGARPRSYVLAAQFSDGTDSDWLAAFARGLADDQAHYGLTLLGGDTTRTPGPTTLSVTMFGECPLGGMIARAGARPGDGVYVSGTIGDAMLGLRCLRDPTFASGSDARAVVEARFLAPEPRTALGPALIGLAHAAADVSDGLVADLAHICAASGVGAEVELERIPLSDAARRLVTDDQPLRHSLLVGGDDYEIVFAAPDTSAREIERRAAEAATPVSRVGRIVERGDGRMPVTVRDASGRAIETGHGGFLHFE